MIKKLLIAIGTVLFFILTPGLVFLGIMHVPIFTAIILFPILVYVAYKAQGSDD